MILVCFLLFASLYIYTDHTSCLSFVKQLTLSTGHFVFGPCRPARDTSLNLRQYKMIVCCEYVTK